MDNIDQIALLRVLIELLNDFAPEGEWRNHELLQKWRTNHYSLTHREMSELCNFLDEQRRLAGMAKFKPKYKQLSLMDQEVDRHE